MNKKDFILGIAVAVLIGVFSYPVISNLDLAIGVYGLLGISAVLAALTIAGLLIMNFLSRWVAVFWQIGKFVVVGGLNTFVDFAILNILIIFTGLAVGFGYSAFKGISFIVAVINSYFWNKYWTFESGREKTAKEFLQFIVVSAVGFGVNVGAASLIVNVFGGQFGISSNLLANVGAAVATILSLIWNFIGYKFIVFKQRET